MPFSQQMKSAFSETERIIHVSLKQLSEKRSEREITNFKVCINKQLAVLRQKCSAMESHFVKKVRSCTNLKESFLVSLMQEGDQPMMSTSKELPSSFREVVKAGIQRVKAAKHRLESEGPFNPHNIPPGKKGQTLKYWINDAIVFQVLMHAKLYC